MRTITKITASPLHAGFLGQGHTASAVVDGTRFPETDPFMLLMDDRLDLPGGPPVGGPHPHAGFETVTLVLQGNERDWMTGSLELMTAGKGVVHTEELTTRTRMRILQLWLVLPPEARNTTPFVQRIMLGQVPTHRTAHSEVRVYSGGSHGLTSPLRNLTPLTLLDVHLQPDAELELEVPGDQNGFVYLVDGDMRVGAATVKEGQAGWFGEPDGNGNAAMVRAGGKGVRFVLYAARPHRASVVAHGPFIADTTDDIHRLYAEYRQGKLPHVNDLPVDRKILHGAVV